MVWGPRSFTLECKSKAAWKKYRLVINYLFSIHPKRSSPSRAPPCPYLYSKSNFEICPQANETWLHILCWKLKFTKDNLLSRFRKENFRPLTHKKNSKWNIWIQIFELSKFFDKLCTTGVWSIPGITAYRYGTGLATFCRTRVPRDNHELEFFLTDCWQNQP